MHISVEIILTLAVASISALGSVSIALWKFSGAHSTLETKVDLVMSGQKQDAEDRKVFKSEIAGTMVTIEKNIDESIKALDRKIDTNNTAVTRRFNDNDTRMNTFLERLVRIETLMEEDRR